MVNIGRLTAAASAARSLSRGAIQDPRGALMARRVHSERLTFSEMHALLDPDVLSVAWSGSGSQEPSSRHTAPSAAPPSSWPASKSTGRQPDVFNVFRLIPPPTDKDGADVRERYEVILSGKAEGFAGEFYYGYQDDLEAQVRTCSPGSASRARLTASTRLGDSSRTRSFRRAPSLSRTPMVRVGQGVLGPNLAEIFRRPESS